MSNYILFPVSVKLLKETHILPFASLDCLLRSHALFLPFTVNPDSCGSNADDHGENWVDYPRYNISRSGHFRGKEVLNERNELVES